MRVNPQQFGAVKFFTNPQRLTINYRLRLSTAHYSCAPTPFRLCRHLVVTADGAG
jgi:hypothetical protein